MKLKRFIAQDMRTALRKVSETLGPDAVILSNKRVEGGIEIVAAVDYDESLLNPSKASQGETAVVQQETRKVEQRQREAALDDIRFGRNLPVEQETRRGNEHLWTQQPEFMQMQNELKSLRGLLVNQLGGLSWGNEVQYHPLRARLLQRLIALGLSPKHAREIAAQVKEEQDFEHNWRLALGELAHRLPIGQDEILQQGGVVSLVGATGVGKTTSIAKLAARYTLKNGPHRVALITTDNYRVAAAEQLRSYARIMGVPMRVCGDIDSLRDALQSFRDKELVLIDTAGMSQRDVQLSQQLAMLKLDSQKPVKTYLTLATNVQRSVLHEVAEAFAATPLAGAVLTKLDETTSLGGALSVAMDHNLPIAYLSDGQQVPEDLHLARSHSLVSRSVTIMQHMVSVSAKDDATLMTIGGMVASNYG